MQSFELMLGTTEHQWPNETIIEAQFVFGAGWHRDHRWQTETVSSVGGRGGERHPDHLRLWEKVEVTKFPSLWKILRKFKVRMRFWQRTFCPLVVSDLHFLSVVQGLCVWVPDPKNVTSQNVRIPAVGLSLSGKLAPAQEGPAETFASLCWELGLAHFLFQVSCCMAALQLSLFAMRPGAQWSEVVQSRRSARNVHHQSRSRGR